MTVSLRRSMGDMRFGGKIGTMAKIIRQRVDQQETAGVCPDLQPPRQGSLVDAQPSLPGMRDERLAAGKLPPVDEERALPRHERVPRTRKLQRTAALAEPRARTADARSRLAARELDPDLLGGRRQREKQQRCQVPAHPRRASARDTPHATFANLAKRDPQRFGSRAKRGVEWMVE